MQSFLLWEKELQCFLKFYWPLWRLSYACVYPHFLICLSLRLWSDLYYFHFIGRCIIYSIAMLKHHDQGKPVEGRIYWSYGSKGLESVMAVVMVAGGRKTGQLEQQLRAHISNHKQESQKVNLTWHKSLYSWYLHELMNTGGLLGSQCAEESLWMWNC